MRRTAARFRLRRRRAGAPRRPDRAEPVAPPGAQTSRPRPARPGPTVTSRAPPSDLPRRSRVRPLRRAVAIGESIIAHRWPRAVPLDRVAPSGVAPWTYCSSRERWMTAVSCSSRAPCCWAWWLQNSSSPPVESTARTRAAALQRSQRSAAVSATGLARVSVIVVLSLAATSGGHFVTVHVRLRVHGLWCVALSFPSKRDVAVPTYGMQEPRHGLFDTRPAHRPLRAVLRPPHRAIRGPADGGNSPVA